MMEKLILLPFWLLKRAVGLVLFAVRTAVGTGTGAARFVLGRRLGTLVMIFLAFLIGKKYLESRNKEAQ
jgi:hypothetical protein